MKNKRNLNTKWLLLQNDQNADTTLLHSHDGMYVSEIITQIYVEGIFCNFSLVTKKMWKVGTK